MKVTFSCSGAVTRELYLASRFAREGALAELFTLFSAAKHPLIARVLGDAGDPYPVPVERIRTDVPVAVRRRLIMRSRDITRTETHLPWQLAFDRRVARRLAPGADIVFAESTVALRTLGRARELGAVAVLDRTNTHIAYQARLMAEEYELLGIAQPNPVPPEVIAHQTAEYEAAERICTLSSFAYRSFVEMGVPEERLMLVPSGTDAERFSPQPKADDVFRVVFVGYVSAKKGVHHLLEAMERAAIPGAELLLVGGVDEHFRPVLDRYPGAYKLAGHVPHRELARVISQGSVFCLPSIEEGLAKVTAEAMACGVPVVATTNTGAEDVVREGVDGFIVPIRDADALAERITRLHDDPALRERMGASALERVRTGFTWEDYGARALAAFEGLLAGRS